MNKKNKKKVKTNLEVKKIFISLHSLIETINTAKIAQLVERDLAKVEVAGSNPVFRSTTVK